MTAFSKEMLSFIEVVREGSIRRAAEILNVSPSSLSRQLTILENSFGMKLLIRLPTGIRLTEPGERAYAKALIWSEDQQELLLSLQQEKQDRPKPVRLGLASCFTSNVVTELHTQLIRHGMNTALEVTVDTSHGLAAALSENKLDIILAFNIASSESLRIYHEQDQALGLVHAPGFDIGASAPLSTEQCLNYPLCLPDRSLSYQPRLMSEIARQKIAPKVMLKCNSIALIKDFVASGKAVTFLTKLDVQWELERGELAITPIKNKRLIEQLSISIPNGKELNSHDKKFLYILIGILTRDSEPVENHNLSNAS